MTTLLRVLVLALSLAALPVGAQASSASFPSSADEARWRSAAQDTTIVRDDWGIAHIHGKTDADAVFGMLFTQAEDDFNRVATNYLNTMGRLAEAEGESAIYQDLRKKLFIRPEELKRQYTASPAWLQKLMIAWADGLNFYLRTHPEVTPRVIHRFEPWMALSFSEGSIGGKVSARAISTGGECGDPKSPHFNDQAARDADGSLREVHFYPAQLVDHTEREYHPH